MNANKFRTIEWIVHNCLQHDQLKAFRLEKAPLIIIIIDAIDNICNASLDILVEMVESKIETKEEEKSNEEEKDHPLLDDAINIFKGKIIS